MEQPPMHTFHNEPQEEATSATKPNTRTTTRRVLKVHGMPRSWLHDDLSEFVEAVATRIDAPSNMTEENNSNEGGSALHSGSPWIHHIRIPFGRRSGVPFGQPLLFLRSNEVADALLQLSQTHLAERESEKREQNSSPLSQMMSEMDGGDNKKQKSRAKEDVEEGGEETLAMSVLAASRGPLRSLYFEDITHLHEADDNDTMRSSSGTTDEVEHPYDAEDRLALETMELDRYLLAPDLLYDKKKMRQRRLVTKSSRIHLESFYEKPNTTFNANGNTEEEEQDGNGSDEVVRVGDVDPSSLGRGNAQNMPIPMPYVRSRRGH